MGLLTAFELGLAALLILSERGGSCDLAVTHAARGADTPTHQIDSVVSACPGVFSASACRRSSGGAGLHWSDRWEVLSCVGLIAYIRTYVLWVQSHFTLHVCTRAYPCLFCPYRAVRMCACCVLLVYSAMGNIVSVSEPSFPYRTKCTSALDHHCAV